jgi:acylphosphatase
MTTRRHVLVEGRVQGVFFRSTCAREATLRGVHGWVRNTLEGSVEAVFEGEEAAVEAMLSWCRVGPRGAHVDHVEALSEPPMGEKEFRIVG